MRLDLLALVFIEERGRKIRCIDLELSNEDILRPVFGRDFLGGAFVFSAHDAEHVALAVTEYAAARASQPVATSRSCLF